MPRAPIDDAALLVLRPLLRDLEAGRVVVTSLQAGDDEHQAIALSWRREQGEPQPAEPEGLERRFAHLQPPPRAPASNACPQCGSPLLDMGGVVVCHSCAYEGVSG